MELAKKEEIKFEKIKLKNYGENGLELKYSFLFGYQGRKQHKSLVVDNDTPPHDDLIAAMKSLNVIVMKIESFDYVRELVNAQGFEATETQISMAEGMIAGKIKDIEVTGVAISEKKKSEGIIISYKKSDKLENISGHCTNWISIDGDYEYGVEDELRDIISDIKDMSYRYEFESWYCDYEQLTIEHEYYGDDDENEVDGVEEANVVGDDN